MQTLPPVTLCEALKLTCKNYLKCSTRARRSEFWKSIIFFYYIFGGSLAGLIMIIQNVKGILLYVFAPILGILVLLTFWTIIILIIRRLHDTGRTGCFIFFYCIPFGFFVLFYYLFLDSENKTNEYGPSPKYIPADFSGLDNNFNQPINPATINPYPQQNYFSMPVNPYPQQPSMSQPISIYPQTPIAQPVYDYPQPNSTQFYMKPSETPNSQESDYPGAAPLPQGNPYP